MSGPVCWLVWRSDSGATNHRHETRESAETEAKRLAGLYPSKDFHVLEVNEPVKVKPPADEHEHATRWLEICRLTGCGDLSPAAAVERKIETIMEQRIGRVIGRLRDAAAAQDATAQRLDADGRKFDALVARENAASRRRLAVDLEDEFGLVAF